ncbi:MAG: YerC/YecD family TrpR-related protein [Acidimicrobiia bacterium]
MESPLTDDDWRTEDTEALFQAILALETPTEAERFFRDLCTRSEIEAFSHRWAVVRRLNQGQSYREIHEETGVSAATITRINEWLQHGTGGYRMMLDRLGVRKASS